MESRDVNLTKTNADKINKLIDNFLKNTRMMGELTSEIMRMILDNHPEVSAEDKRKCSMRENKERRAWIESETRGRDLTDSERLAYEREATAKIRKIRFHEAYIMLQEYRRLSHILDIGGYDWDKFFNRPEDEPAKERGIREMMDDDDTRDKYRNLAVTEFVKHSYKYWPSIKSKDIKFLTDHLHALFPNSEYTDKLEIIYGRNDEKKSYISNENLERIWRMIHGTVKTSIKYMLYSGVNTFHFTTKVNGEDVIQRTLVVDVEAEIERWAVDPEVR